MHHPHTYYTATTDAITDTDPTSAGITEGPSADMPELIPETMFPADSLVIAVADMRYNGSMVPVRGELIGDISEYMTEIHDLVENRTSAYLELTAQDSPPRRAVYRRLDMSS